MTDDLLTRLEIEDASVLWGVDVVFVSTLLICGDKGLEEYEIVWGCTRFQPKRSTVYLSGDRYFWGQVFCHELAHTLDVFLFGGNGDPGHDKTKWWRTVEDIDG